MGKMQVNGTLEDFDIIVDDDPLTNISNAVMNEMFNEIFTEEPSFNNPEEAPVFDDPQVTEPSTPSETVTEQPKSGETQKKRESAAKRQKEEQKKQEAEVPKPEEGERMKQAEAEGVKQRAEAEQTPPKDHDQETAKTNTHGKEDTNTYGNENSYEYEQKSEYQEGYTSSYQDARASGWDNSSVEVEMDPEKENRWSHMNIILQNSGIKTMIKKGLLLLLLIGIFVGVPILLFSLIGRSRTQETVEPSTEADNSGWAFNINPSGTQVPETEATTEGTTQSAQVPDITVTVDTPEISADISTLPPRFPTLQDLSLYINSSTATILITEKQAISDYINGVISKDACQNQLAQCTAASNEVLHLLAVNQKLFINEGKAQEYDNLESDLIEVMYYGDVASSLIKSDTPIPQIIQTLNIQ